MAQLAHNPLAYFKEWLLGGTEAKKLGVERLVREVLAMPAEARMGRKGTKLSLKVPELHPWAKALVCGVEARFPPVDGVLFCAKFRCQHFSTPSSTAFSMTLRFS